MRQRKVSTFVPAKQHAQLRKIATRRGTTIGELVAFGARLSVLFFQTGGEMQPALAPDHRRKQGE